MLGMGLSFMARETEMTNSDHEAIQRIQDKWNELLKSNESAARLREVLAAVEAAQPKSDQ